MSNTGCVFEVLLEMSSTQDDVTSDKLTMDMSATTNSGSAAPPTQNTVCPVWASPQTLDPDLAEAAAALADPDSVQSLSTNSTYTPLAKFSKPNAEKAGNGDPSS